MKEIWKPIEGGIIYKDFSDQTFDDLVHFELA